MKSEKKHIKCIIWKTMWGIGAVSLLAGLISINNGLPFFGLSTSFWYWNALVFGILSIPIKLDCHDCSVCNS